MGFSELIAVAGILPWCTYLEDGYSVFKYALLSAICLAFIAYKRPKSSGLDFPAYLYFFALLVASISGGLAVSFVGKQNNYFTGVLPTICVLVSYHLSIGADLKRLERAVAWSTLVCAGLAIAQSYGYLLTSGDYFQGRVYACQGSPVFLGGLLGVLAPISYRVLGPLSMPVLAWAIYLTQSRSGVISGGVGLLAYFAHERLIPKKIAALLATAVLGACVFAFAGKRGTGDSDMGRYHMTRVALEVISDFPILGIGPERFGGAMRAYRTKEIDHDLSPQWTNYYTHNQFLEALVSGGLVLFSTYIVLILCIGLYTWNMCPPEIFGACAAMFTYAMFQPTPLALKAIMACLIGATATQYRESPKPIRWFLILGAALAFIFSVRAVAYSRVSLVGIDIGNGNILVGAFNYNKSAMGDQ